MIDSPGSGVALSGKALMGGGATPSEQVIADPGPPAALCRDVLATDLPEGSSILPGRSPKPERGWREFFLEVISMLTATKQYAWDGKKELVPGETCKLIATHQWQEVRRVAFALMQRPKVLALGWPDPVADGVTGRAGLRWAKGQGEQQWFEVYFSTLSSQRYLLAEWVRRNDGGTLTGRSRDLLDLAAAIESTFRS
jgi:hypothetical protein